jgi:hypothetical protein
MPTANDLLSHGWGSEEDVASLLFRLGAEELVQEMRLMGHIDSSCRTGI